jgi:hypothetical protein
VDLGLKGKVALVAASSNGLGKASALALAREGARVTIPLGRLGEPIELGNLVAFLASQHASYITGAVYQVDGATSNPTSRHGRGIGVVSSAPHRACPVADAQQAEDPRDSPNVAQRRGRRQRRARPAGP